MPSFWPKPLFGQEKVTDVMGRGLTSQTVTSIVGKIFGHSWPSFSKWSTHHRSDSRSLNLCRTKNLSGRRRLRSTVFSTTRSMTPQPGHLEKRFSISNMLSCRIPPNLDDSAFTNGSIPKKCCFGCLLSSKRYVSFPHDPKGNAVRGDW